MPGPQQTAEDGSAANSEEIRRVYAGRDAHKGDRYAFYQGDVRLQVAQREWALAAFLRKAFDGTLHDKRLLDVGCGNGGLLRLLCDWGANPRNCQGTELLADRLERAEMVSPPGMAWHLGDVESLPPGQYDLVTAFTVFTSVLDQDLRDRIAQQMWARVKPGGWVLLFDFRMNNPNNPNVRKLTLAEMKGFWPAKATHYRTILLPPPLVRWMAPISFLLPQLLERVCPFLRSHFLYAAQK